MYTSGGIYIYIYIIYIILPMHVCFMHSIWRELVTKDVCVAIVAASRTRVSPASTTTLAVNVSTHYLFSFPDAHILACMRL